MKAALAIGLAGLLVSALAWTLEPTRFFAAWLAATFLLAAWTLGSLGLLLIHALTGGRWGETVRPALFAGLSAMPLLVPAAAILAFGVPHLYPWARPGAHPPNAFYLNTAFLAARGILYLAAWLAMGALAWRGRAPAAPTLFLLGVTVSFAAIDIIMSLDPSFTSSIFGMLTACGMVLFALSLAVLVSVPDAPPQQRADLSKLLLALVVLFIYLDFMQLLIVWQSDLASETPWYLQRSRGFWGAVRILIALGHVLLPIALLLSPRTQRAPGVLLAVAGLLVLTEALRSWWTVLPSLGFALDWQDIAALAGLGGMGAAAALWRRPALLRGAQHV